MDKIAYAKNMIRAADYIEKNIKTKIQINALAKYAYMSEDHFWRVFKKLFREPVGAYIRKRRLTLMAEKLLHDSRDVSDICVEYGYESVEVFFRGFKKQFGVTPSKYRRQHRALTYFLRRERMTGTYIRHILGGGISLMPSYKTFKETVLRGISSYITRDSSVGQGIIFAVTGLISNVVLGGKDAAKRFIIVSGGNGKGIFTDSDTVEIFRGKVGGPGRVVRRLKKGRYAVYKHKGSMTTFRSSCEYIFMHSLPPETAKKAPYLVVHFMKSSILSGDFEMEFRVPVN